MKDIKIYEMLKADPYLVPFQRDLKLRADLLEGKRAELLAGNEKISDFAQGYRYFGIHQTHDGWVYREWAPAADKMFLTGDFNGWELYSHPLTRLENGVFEIRLLGKDALMAGQKIQAVVISGGQILRRVPTYATRVVQDEHTYLWCAEVEETLAPFKWTDDGFTPDGTPFIYECHIGMSLEEGRVATYTEFKEQVLPRIKKEGYNTLQIMAVMEHPYYGSFGYQVSNFFAPSSRFGTSAELKSLINTAHEMGIAVLLDVVHSHAVKNTNEGLNEFDGTSYQFFHEGPAGEHSAWGTKLFNYGKNQVLHFLLSNLRYWVEVFHFDGFRFDGVTSMLYHDHGLGTAFDSYDKYFSMNTDTDAVTYLQLANELVHELNSSAITIAEDMSGMPGMCLPIEKGGIGFDYRLSMGVPDMWIKTVKEQADENWDIPKLWYELTTRRPMEKNIGYCESHDQALVGDKTLMFRLCDAEMYCGMQKFGNNPTVDRGIALHKIIRLLTASLAGEGYLNFMGNEFGHPEWIDFPREGNGWSYHYCRRQWSLVDNKELRYCELGDFDKAMLTLLKQNDILNKRTESLWMHNDDKVLMYAKGDCIFVINLNPVSSFEGYRVPTPCGGNYRVVLSSDDAEFGGYSRVDATVTYTAKKAPDGAYGFPCYLPCRAAFVLKKQP